ncbi:P-loop containing nucleoside triphosphate hydrolase protein [Aspergillus minisclerotigenes]|uniref:P-loop containing nucleoside triphosphate hydrolase protein n=1 Tax=Aspergillus minisclerotigenes TaxID=656917 RepID=A0A5N6INV5_9EURO|nr:P-loop containing nucleoside triphosphate hydrolase protein [Aspergillus minisclerotigenes]
MPAGVCAENSVPPNRLPFARLGPGVLGPSVTFLYDSTGMLSDWLDDVACEQSDSPGVPPLVVPNILDHVWPSMPQAVRGHAVDAAKVVLIPGPKPEFVIAVIGNAQSGKSTLLESLVNELGGTYVSRELFPLEVETPAHNVTLYDIPDIASLWGSMQDGTIKPDAAVLCLSASSGEGVGGNDDETAVYLAATKELGIPQLAVAITKMDDTNWSQSRFNELVKETANLASRTKPARWNPRQLPFIPVSGLEGENLTNGTYNQPWFTGWSNVTPRGAPREGMTLLGAIDAFEPGQ